jgi:serine/threonine protein kinase
VFRALVACIEKLDKHYDNFLRFSATIPNTVSNGAFPRIMAGIELRYRRRLLDGKQLWLATMDDNGVDRRVVVKFTCRYATEVHHACAEKGIAPALRYSQRLGSGWIMVVMDHLDGYHSLFDLQRKKEQRLTEDMRKSVHASLKILHDAKFVHGDMRPPNILLGPDDDVKFIDFDWAGNVNETRYPASMNPNIGWHPDVGLGKPIETKHDTYLVDEIFTEFRQPISPLGRRRFCEWDSEYGKNDDLV